MFYNFQVCVKTSVSGQPSFYPPNHLILLSSPRAFVIRGIRPMARAANPFPILVLIPGIPFIIELLFHFAPIPKIREGDACARLTTNNNRPVVNLHDDAPHKFVLLQEYSEALHLGTERRCDQVLRSDFQNLGSTPQHLLLGLSIGQLAATQNVFADTAELIQLLTRQVNRLFFPLFLILRE